MPYQWLVPYPCKARTILDTLHKMKMAQLKLQVHILEAALASRKGGIDGAIADMQFIFLMTQKANFDAGTAILCAELLDPRSYRPTPAALPNSK